MSHTDTTGGFWYFPEEAGDWATEAPYLVEAHFGYAGSVLDAFRMDLQAIEVDSPSLRVLEEA